MAGTYSTSTDGTSDSDVLENVDISGCTESAPLQAFQTPCSYTGETTTLTSLTPVTGTVASGSDSGNFVSTSSIQDFYSPQPTFNIAQTSGVAWQGALSQAGGGSELIAMPTSGGNAVLPSILFAVSPMTGGSAASISGSFQIFSIGTNVQINSPPYPGSCANAGTAGDEGILEAATFDGAGNMAGAQESVNCWNANTMTGGIFQSTTCPHATYTLDASGNMTLTYTSAACSGQQPSVLSGYTFTGAYNGTAFVLTNADPSGPRILLVGIAQSPGSSKCGNGSPLNPTVSGGSAIWATVALSYNSSALAGLTFSNSSSGPYPFSINGGTLNTGGAISTTSSAGPFSYTIDGNCFITIARQNVNSVQLDRSLGVVDTGASVLALEDFDTSGGGPVLTIGVRVENLVQLN